MKPARNAQRRRARHRSLLCRLGGGRGGGTRRTRVQRTRATRRRADNGVLPSRASPSPAPILIFSDVVDGARVPCVRAIFIAFCSARVNRTKLLRGDGSTTLPKKKKKTRFPFSPRRRVFFSPHAPSRVRPRPTQPSSSSSVRTNDRSDIGRDAAARNSANERTHVYARKSHGHAEFRRNARISFMQIPIIIFYPASRPLQQ